MEDNELRDEESVRVWKEKISEVNSREWREEVEEKSSLKWYGLVKPEFGLEEYTKSMEGQERVRLQF